MCTHVLHIHYLQVLTVCGVSFRFMPRVEIVQKHNTAARRLYIRGHNGKIYPYLVMNDACLTESRREERVLQLLRLLNPCLEKRKETTKRHLFFTGMTHTGLALSTVSSLRPPRDALFLGQLSGLLFYVCLVSFPVLCSFIYHSTGLSGLSFPFLSDSPLSYIILQVCFSHFLLGRPVFLTGSLKSPLCVSWALNPGIENSRSE